MNDYSFGSGWGDNSFSADYGLSPYGSGYSNQGFQVPSFNNSNNGYSDSGTNYSLGTSYGGSSGGFSTPTFGDASNGFMGSPVDYGLSPYQPLYSNTGLIPRSSWTQEQWAESGKNNYGGLTAGGDYVPYPSNYFNPSFTPAAPVSEFGPSGYNTEGFNRSGFNSMGLNRGGLDTMGRNYNPNTGLNYRTGGFNYDSGLTPFEGSTFTTAATADTGGANTEFNPNTMVKEDMRRRLDRGERGEQPQNGQALSGLVQGLNNLFSSKNAGNTVSTLAGLYQGGKAGQANEQQAATIAQQQAVAAQQQAFAQKQAESLSSMFGQDSSYAQALRKQLDRKDAQGGRRSQYGTREVELQARLADAASRVAPNIAQFNGQANSIGNGIIANGKLGVDNRNQGLATGGQQLARGLSLAGTAGAFSGLGNMFSGIGNNGNRAGNRDVDNYDLQGTNNLTGGGNFWDSWFT